MALEPGGPQGNRVETECLAHGPTVIFLTFFHVQLPVAVASRLPCNMAGLGNTCTGGDQQACQYFSTIVQANKDCYLGNQDACAYIAQQPLLRPIGPGGSANCWPVAPL